MMKLPKLPVRKKLRASTARRSMASADEMEYEEMSEPNMKLSRALLIVLVLHVVAVAGIIAFNTIKSRQGGLPPASVSATPARSTATPPAGPAAAASAAVAKQAPLPSTTTDAKPAEEVTAARALPVNSSDTGRTYVVAKGDNPVSIARKLSVSKDELLALNKITDPTKLQIGQTLMVPAKTISKPKPKATPKPKAKSTPKKAQPVKKTKKKTTKKSRK